MGTKKNIFLSLLVCFVCILPETIFCEAQKGDDMLPTIALVTTGGTIAGNIDPETGGVVPVLTGQDLVLVIPGLQKLVKIEVFEFCSIDSSQMMPEVRRDLSLFVDSVALRPDITGIIITHGTDTIDQTAYFLDLTLQTKKPVVLVGAMRDASAVSPDGPENIYNAALQILSDEAKGFGVTVTMNQYIHAAEDVEKIETTNVQAFSSGKKGCLGYIAVEQVYKFRDVEDRKKIMLAEKMHKVVLLKTFSGDEGDFVRYAVDTGAMGIVIEGFGAGNVNKQVFDAIQYALAHGVAVVIATSIADGAVYPIYGGPGGGAELARLGVMFAGSLSGQKARILLMLALSQGLSLHELVNLF